MKRRIAAIILLSALISGMLLAIIPGMFPFFNPPRVQAATQYQVGFSQTGVGTDFNGTVFTVDGTNYNQSQTPTFTWNNGTSHSFAFQSPLIASANAKQYLWTNTTGLSTLQSGNITVTGSGNVTGNYKTQYHLTVASAYDSPAPASGWFDNGTSINANVTSPVSGGTGTQYVCTGWNGTGSVPSSGSTSSTSFTLLAPSSITWNWKTQYQITFNQTGVGTDYTGPVFTVDGTNYTRSSSPSFWWDNGSSHTFAFQAPLVVSANAKQYLWTNTTGLSTLQSGNITVTGPGNVTGNYKTQYYLTVVSVYGSPAPTSGWFDSGTSINANVTSPVSGGLGTQYVCTGWTGTGSAPSSGTTNSTTFTILASSSITWNWKTQYQITFSQTGVNSDFTGTVFTVDGTNYTRSSSPSFWWDNGSSHTFAFQARLVVGSNAEQYLWIGTNGLSTAQSGSLTITSPGNVIGNYKTQYYLTVVSLYDSPAPASGWFDNGTSINATVTSQIASGPGTQIIFLGWTGTGSVPATGTTNSTTFTILASSSITWNWKTQYQITFNQTGVGTDYTGTVFTVDGTNYNQSQTPTFWWDNGSLHTFAFLSPLVVAPNSEQYLWTGTSSLSTLQSGSLTVTGSGSVTGNYKTQYYLTVTSAYDSPAPTSGWFDNGTTINATVTSTVSGGSGTQRVCTGWTGTGSVPATGSANSTSFTILAASSITWSWKTQYYLSLSSSYGSPTGQGWYDAGSTASFSVISPVSGGPGTQYVLTGWSSGDSGGYTGSSVSASVTINNPITEMASWKTQYQLMVSQTGVGSDFTGTVVVVDGTSYSVSGLPASFWWDNGSSHTFAFQARLVVGSNAEQYLWIGTNGLSTAQSGSLTITSPGNVIGNYKTQYYLTVVSLYDSPAPTSGWFDNGTSINATVTSPVSGGPGTQCTCLGWNGTGSVPTIGSATAVTFTILSPSSITWDWKAQFQITFNQTGVGTDYTGTVFTVDGTNYNQSQTPTFWWDNDSSHTFGYLSPLVVGPGVEPYCWSSTTGLSTLQSTSIIIIGPGTVTGNYAPSAHAVIVTQITSNVTWLYQGQTASINVTVSDVGTLPENASVNLYADITSLINIGEYRLQMNAGQSYTLLFIWDRTTEYSVRSYNLTAVATIPTGSNTLSNGTVTIRLMGDVNGDGVVNMKDIALVARAFGSHPGSPNWNPAADLNGDGVVNMKDIALVARHFGQHV